MNREITHGVYRHFKGNRYEVLHIAQYTETNELLVIYKALYGVFGTGNNPMVGATVAVAVAVEEAQKG